LRIRKSPRCANNNKIKQKPTIGKESPPVVDELHSKFNGKNVSLIELPIKFWKEIGGSKLSGMEYIRIAKELVTILGIIQICFKATKK
jgi:hypothetical protein